MTLRGGVDGALRVPKLPPGAPTAGEPEGAPHADAGVFTEGLSVFHPGADEGEGLNGVPCKAALGGVAEGAEVVQLVGVIVQPEGWVTVGPVGVPHEGVGEAAGCPHAEPIVGAPIAGAPQPADGCEGPVVIHGEAMSPGCATGAG